ncbi:PilN domain-containing protein [Alteromonas facilis]|uniref:PilN domain-containing protein n=1 Tax=Alteromonas facilis TaxID=2048004 RepID=UPI000C285AC7|nr:PilN domain-containing protein [Alteromonas facilis]
MKTRVNLYLNEFRPTLDLLSLGTLITVFAVLFIVVITARVGLMFSGSKNAQQLAQMSVEVEQNNNLARELTNVLQQRKEDPQLLAVFAGLQASLQAKERLRQALSERELMKSATFSNLLRELAQQHHQELWLTRIKVSGHSMVFDGQALTPTALPQWINSLGQTQYFAGKEFDQARVYREEQGLLFSLSATRDGTEQATSPGGQR